MNHTIRPRGAGLILALTGALLITTAAAGGAQEAQEPADRDCLCIRGPAPRAATSFFRADRARIGVQLGETTTAAGRTGVRVERTEEGGPAARAGIRAGDVLVGLDGVGLGDDPGSRLVERLADTEPADTVEVEFVRDGQVRTARVVTDRWPGFSFSGGDGVRVFPRGDFEFDGPAAFRAMRPAILERRMSREGLRLTELNAGLGEYFGTTEGVLVLEVEAESLGLRAGDVILSIGGRAVQDADHAHSILRSFRPDEDIRFQIMRRNRRIEVAGRSSR